jgi:hypothetical protein
MKMEQMVECLLAEMKANQEYESQSGKDGGPDECQSRREENKDKG